MDVTNLSPDKYGDLFPSENTNNKPLGAPVKFGSEMDMFSTPSVAETTTIPPSTTDTTTILESSTTDTTTVPDQNPDILGVDAKDKPGTTKSPTISGLSEYFEDRLKAGKFVAIDDTNEKGETIKFIPKTPEEFDEVIDIQVNYKLDQRKKEIEDSWYQSKSPAWQAVARYAEMTNDPSEILLFIQGVKTVDSVSALDPSDIASAEQIVRTRLEQRGETDDMIGEQIEALKTTDKLISTAQKYKPIILQEEKNYLSQMVQEKKAREEEYLKDIEEISNSAIKTIDSPLFGKYKLKQDEKAAIYQLIGAPSPETKGYAIYNMIDNLFEKRDMETLRQVALFLTKKDSFLSYTSQSASDRTAAGLQRQLRVANDSRSSSNGDTSDDGDGKSNQSVKRTQYTPKFGRG